MSLQFILYTVTGRELYIIYFSLHFSVLPILLKGVWCQLYIYSATSNFGGKLAVVNNGYHFWLSVTCLPTVSQHVTDTLLTVSQTSSLKNDENWSSTVRRLFTNSWPTNGQQFANWWLTTSFGKCSSLLPENLSGGNRMRGMGVGQLGGDMKL